MLEKKYERFIQVNESPRRKQRGIKDQNRKKHSPQAAGYLPEEKIKKLLKFLKEDKGASTVEYGLLVTLIAAVIIGAVTLLGGNLKATFEYIATMVLKPYLT